MAKQLNTAQIMGRVVRDPFVNEGGKLKSARFTLACDRGNKDDSGTDFIPCIAFGKTADFVQKFLVKGSWIVVQGKISTGQYTNKKGDKVYTVEVMANEFYFCGSSKNTVTPKVEGEPQAHPQDINDYINVPSGFDDDDEAPFR